MNKKEFSYTFRIKRGTYFNIAYYTLSTNKNAHFTTSADVMNKPRTDYNRCGQAQESLLPTNTKARKFYDKWDELHVKDLTQEQYNAILQDIEILKIHYPYIEGSPSIYGDGINFSSQVEFDRNQTNKYKREVLEIATTYDYKDKGQTVEVCTPNMPRYALGKKIIFIDNTGMEQEGYIYKQDYREKSIFIQF